MHEWKSAIEKRKSFSALLTNLSNESECFSQELLLVKLHANVFGIAA